MRNIEKIKKEFGEKKIEITADKFVEKAAEVLAKEPMVGVIETNPILILAFAMYQSELTAELFGFESKKDENKEESEAKE